MRAMTCSSPTRCPMTFFMLLLIILIEGLRALKPQTNLVVSPPPMAKTALTKSSRPKESFSPQWYRRFDTQEHEAQERTGITWYRWPGFLVGTSHRKQTKSEPSPHRISQGEAHREQLAQTATVVSKWGHELAESSSPSSSGSKSVTTVQQLHRCILDEQSELRDLHIRLEQPVPVSPLGASSSQNEQHPVIQLIVHRFRTESKPGNRPSEDKTRLALCNEGGGMRGAVTAGMVAAIVSLGLSDAFDVVYGSSAGSVVGAYLVSRQMCMDVYVDILPAAKRTFVCTRRIMSALIRNTLDCFVSYCTRINLPKLTSSINSPSPGMNISFVLDGIMDERHGIRPLDMECFRDNDRRQPLRVVSSYAQNGTLRTKCFGTNDFFGDSVRGLGPAQRVDGKQYRGGLFACLEASMTVPGATGPPVHIDSNNETLAYFDAFCFEPIPYRSAVDEGATHALVLCSRPDGYQPATRQGVYERGVAPIYFHAHGQPEVAEFFRRGGQQYVYAEDLLTLQEGKCAGNSPIVEIRDKGVLVPPPQILYGVKANQMSQQLAQNRHHWKRAHLLPLQVPIGTRELHTLEQDRDEVTEAVRSGFAAAFDLLAPAIGVDLGTNFTGMEVAKLLFPSSSVNEDCLLSQLRVNGERITDKVAEANAMTKKPSSRPWKPLQRTNMFSSRYRRFRTTNWAISSSPNRFDQFHGFDAETRGRVVHILNQLPGLQTRHMSHLARGIREIYSIA